MQKRPPEAIECSTELIVREDGVVLEAKSTFLEILTPPGTNANPLLQNGAIPAAKVLKKYAPKDEPLMVKHLLIPIFDIYEDQGILVQMRITPVCAIGLMPKDNVKTIRVVLTNADEPNHKGPSQYIPSNDNKDKIIGALRHKLSKQFEIIKDLKKGYTYLNNEVLALQVEADSLRQQLPKEELFRSLYLQPTASLYIRHNGYIQDIIIPKNWSSLTNPKMYIGTTIGKNSPEVWSDPTTEERVLEKIQDTINTFSVNYQLLEVRMLNKISRGILKIEPIISVFNQVRTIFGSLRIIPIRNN